jgi:diguanylate cyclase (GGDEF)-like protein
MAPFMVRLRISMEPKAQSPGTTKRADPLSQVLKNSEDVRDLVEECALDLSSVNSGIKQELESLDPSPGVANALGKNEAIQDKVQEASERLLLVNDALEGQVRDRNMLEFQLAAVVEQEQAARLASLHDALTDLPNRALFNDRLEHGLAQASRHQWGLAVMFLDLNNFKSVNDSHGHDVGDCVLQTVASRLKKITRIDDTVSRHGGDEFLYLLLEIQGKMQLRSIARKIIEAIQAPCDIDVGDGTIQASVGVSIGISIYPNDGTTVDALIKNADSAMYQAKYTKSGYSFAE